MTSLEKSSEEKVRFVEKVNKPMSHLWIMLGGRSRDENNRN